MQYSSDASGRLTGLVTVINTTPVAFKDLELSFAVPKVRVRTCVCTDHADHGIED